MKSPKSLSSLADNDFHEKPVYASPPSSPLRKRAVSIGDFASATLTATINAATASSDSVKPGYLHHFILWRDFLFLIALGSALQLVFWVETHPGTGLTSTFLLQYLTPGLPTSQSAIVDSGFILTTSLHNYLSINREMNDILAQINSLALGVAMFYVIKVT